MFSVLVLLFVSSLPCVYYGRKERDCASIKWHWVGQQKSAVSQLDQGTSEQYWTVQFVLKIHVC